MIEDLVRVALMHSEQGVIFSFSKHANQVRTLETVLNLLNDYYLEVFTNSSYVRPDVWIEPDRRQKPDKTRNPGELGYILYGKPIDSVRLSTKFKLGFLNIWPMNNAAYLTYGVHFTMRNRSSMRDKFIYDKVLTTRETKGFYDYVQSRLSPRLPYPVLASSHR